MIKLCDKEYLQDLIELIENKYPDFPEYEIIDLHKSISRINNKYTKFKASQEFNKIIQILVQMYYCRDTSNSAYKKFISKLIGKINKVNYILIKYSYFTGKIKLILVLSVLSISLIVGITSINNKISKVDPYLTQASKDDYCFCDLFYTVFHLFSDEESISEHINSRHEIYYLIGFEDEFINQFKLYLNRLMDYRSSDRRLKLMYNHILEGYLTEVDIQFILDRPSLFKGYFYVNENNQLIYVSERNYDYYCGCGS